MIFSVYDYDFFGRRSRLVVALLRSAGLRHELLSLVLAEFGDDTRLQDCR